MTNTIYGKTAASQKAFSVIFFALYAAERKQRNAGTVNGEQRHFLKSLWLKQCFEQIQIIG
jgi:hypothetical protein